MSINPYKNHQRPPTLKFLKKDSNLYRNYPTLINDLQKKQPFNYHSYLNAINFWEKQKLKRQIRTQSLTKNFNNHTVISASNGFVKMHETELARAHQTINHDLFPFQNSKKAIYRLKLNKNIQSIKVKREKVEMLANTFDLHIIKKEFTSRQQRQLKKSDFLEKNTICNSTFYLLNRSKSIDNESKLLKDFETLQSIKQISPW